MISHFFTLSNGLRVLFIDTKAFSSITTLLLIGAGSRYENKKNNGIAHFFEHMAFKGTKKYPNSLIISSVIEGLGGIFNAFTSKDHTGYWVKATNVHFNTVIEVLSDMILNSLLKNEEIEREKGVIVEEINMYEDTPQKKVGEVFEGLLYKENSLGYDIAGTKDTVSAFNRKTFTDYMNSLYHPSNTVLVVAGGLSQVKSQKSKVKSHLEIIKKKFAGWKKGEKIDFTNIKENQKKPQQFIKYKKTEQAHFCLGFRTFSFFDNRKYALSVLSTILGGGMSSRLFIEVRERRGLCYYISTGRESYHDVGNIVTQAGVTNRLDKVKEAVEVILKEHNKIKEGAIRKEELLKAKEMIKGRILLSMEDSANVATYFGTKMILEGKIETPEEAIKKIEKVTVGDIVKLATEIFNPERVNFAMIGPFKQDCIKIENLM
jgi:predicted Zn-dependent peptidase